MKDNKLNKLGFGAWQIGGSSILDNSNKGWNDIAFEEAVHIVERAYGLGIRFFDTSCSYGQGKSEEILGKALHDKQGVVICSKYGLRFNNGQASQDFSADNLRRSLSESLKRLNRDSIDYFLMHSPDTASITPEIIQAFEEVKTEGLISKSGLSVSFIEPYTQWIGHFDSFELLYNPISKQNLEFLHLLNDKEVFFRSIFASGLLLKSPDFFKQKGSISDWRRQLPDFLFEQAEKFALAEPDLSKRYHAILEEALEIKADRIILGISKDQHMNALASFISSIN